MAKKKKEIRDMSKDQLVDHIEVLKKELFNLKIEIMSGQNNNTSNVSKIKKDIARAKTFINIQSKEVESSNAYNSEINENKNKYNYHNFLILENLLLDQLK